MNEILAGAAKVDITPKRGIQLGGNQCRLRPRNQVRDPIYARALVCQQGNTRICFLSLDVVYISEQYTEEIRQRAQATYGLDPAAVMVHCTQVHSAPNIGRVLVAEECQDIPPEYYWLRGGDRDYDPFVVPLIIEAIGEAIDKLTPVQIAYGGRADGRVAYNRRYIMRDGSVRVNPRPDELPNVLHREGPIDPEVGLLALRGLDGDLVSVLLHFTCHPTHFLGIKGYVSAGWPGAWVNLVQSRFGGSTCTPLIANGSCGNIHHRDHLNPDHVEDPDQIARWLTETSERVAADFTFQENGPLAYRSTTITIPWQPQDPEQVAWATQLVAENPEPYWVDKEEGIADWDWIFAVAVKDHAKLIARTEGYPYEIQAFRIGDVALLALVGEPFVEGQLKIKLNSPAVRTFVAHMSNGWAGYIPTYDGFHRGGMSTNDDGRPVIRGANWFRLIPEALDMIADASVQLLEELFALDPVSH